MWISIPCSTEGLRGSTHSHRDIPDVLQCAQHSLQHPEGLHWNTPSNVGVPPPGFALVSLVLSIAPFKPSLKLFPWALAIPQSVPLLPGQAGWVTTSPCTPFHANPHKTAAPALLYCLWVPRVSFIWQGLVTIVLHKSHQMLWHLLWFSARSVCFPEMPHLRNSLECSTADRAGTGSASLGDWVFICFFNFSSFLCPICCQNTKFLPVLSITTSSRGLWWKMAALR